MAGDKRGIFIQTALDQGKRNLSQLQIGFVVHAAVTAGQAEMLAQRRAFVFLAKQAAPLQNGHDLIDEIIERPGNYGGMMLKPSAAPAVEPGLERVRQLLGVNQTPDDGPWRRRRCAQLAKGQAVAPCEARPSDGVPRDPAVGRQIGQRPIEVG